MLPQLVLPVAALAAFLVTCSSERLVAQQNEKPKKPLNFILIMADDLGWGDTGYNGHPELKTPGLDAMARNGLRFNRFYAAAPVCSPTRGSCLTGRHPFRYGIFFANVGRMKPQEITVAEYLKDIGYRTGHFGKWHLGTLTTKLKDSNRGGPKNKKDFSPPDANGFDQYFSTEAKTPTYDPLLKPQGKVSGKYWLPLKDRNQGVAYGTNYWRNGKQVKEDLPGDDSKVIMDEAIRFIESGPKEKFLSVIWFHAPHLPVVASDQDRAAFPRRDAFAQSYLGCVAALDRQVVRLRKKLRELEIADHTVVFFCSDNGPEGNSSAPGSASKLKGRKRSLYEGGIRVPGIAEWPDGIMPGSVTDSVGVTSDYLPTIVQLTGGETPNRPLDGVSLIPVFKNSKRLREKPVYFESRKMAAMIEQKYKLVAQLNSKSKKIASVELYDLEKDISESKNLADDFPERIKSMKSTLRAWRASCKNSLNGADYR